MIQVAFMHVNTYNATRTMYCRAPETFQVPPHESINMRRANRIDANQNTIVETLRKAGAYVRIVTMGDGVPDLLVGYKGYTLLLEVKDSEKPPSARKLTAAEQKFFNEWTGGMLAVVNSPEEALDILKACI